MSASSVRYGPGVTEEVGMVRVKHRKVNIGDFLITAVKVKVKVPILIVERRGPELILDSRQSACK